MEDQPQEEETDYVAFVSGLEIGSKYNDVCLTMLKKFLRGEIGGEKERKLSSQIKRLIICGNSIQEPTNQDDVNRGAFRT